MAVGQVEQDFVWGEMLSYWEQSGQIGPGEASAWGYLDDDQEWRDLGYQVSFGSPYDGDDPQLGADTRWHANDPMVSLSAGQGWGAV